MVEGSLEVKFPTIRTDGKAEVGRVREERGRKKKMQGREKVETLFFQCFVAPEGREVGCRLAKAAGAEPSWEMRDEICTPLWPEAHFEIKMCKRHHCWSTFGR